MEEHDELLGAEAIDEDLLARVAERVWVLVVSQKQIGIPLKPAATSQQIQIPIDRRAVRVATAAISANVGVSDPRISDEIYEDVVRTIRAVGNSFERLPKTTGRFNEEELRDVLLFILNSNYEGLARGEVFNGAGKTDILIPYHDHNPFVGECKVWRGQKKFSAAIDQLLGYTVWRDTKAALVLFINDGNAANVIEKADRCIQDHSCFVSAPPSSDPDSRRDYLLHAIDDRVKQIQVALLPIVVRQLQAPQARPDPTPANHVWSSSATPPNS